MLFSNTKLLIFIAQSGALRGGVLQSGTKASVIIMVNVIPPDHMDDAHVVELIQHDDVPVDPEPVLVDEDEDPKEEKIEEEEDDDMEVDI
ncbi:hypothetical protein Tco_0651583 [Tanacetum coccineum]|uniref:Uncharacterized protein n=1 Tax=Tanacetum coccineum TaxID=301880 RepID=A0ABQ4WV63_9ASTR